jgi:hypothetical protein
MEEQKNPKRQRVCDNDPVQCCMYCAVAFDHLVPKGTTVCNNGLCFVHDTCTKQAAFHADRGLAFTLLVETRLFPCDCAEGGGFDMGRTETRCPCCESFNFVRLAHPGTIVRCTTCTSDFCRNGCEVLHYNETCSDHQALQQRFAVQAQLRCPGCGSSIAKDQPDNAISCFCDTTFCALCNYIYQTPEDHFCGLYTKEECDIADCKHVPHACPPIFTPEQQEEFLAARITKPKDQHNLVVALIGLSDPNSDMAILRADRLFDNNVLCMLRDFIF